MQVTDVVADMLTRIRNANSAKHEKVNVPCSNMKKAIADILVEEGFIKGYEVSETDNKQGMITITLKYGEGKTRTIEGLRRVSKPGTAYLCFLQGHSEGQKRPRHRDHFHLEGAYDR